MLAQPPIDPVLITLGPVKIHWYGVMYLVGFWGGWGLAVRRARMPHIAWPSERVGDLLFYVVMGVIVGGRLGYTFFYNFDEQHHLRVLSDPLVLFRVWEGGMSFHGGLLGVMVAMIVFARQRAMQLLEVSDFVAVVVPFGLFTGRIGNFINGELWGKVTSLPWGMVFKTAPDSLPRHPSQVYEALLEGVVLLACLWLYGLRPRPRGATTGLFLVLYGSFRFAIEFVRLPDAQLGYLAFGWLTMGQVLCLPMLLGGAYLLASAEGRGTAAPGPAVARAGRA